MGRTLFHLFAEQNWQNMRDVTNGKSFWGTPDSNQSQGKLWDEEHAEKPWTTGQVLVNVACPRFSQ